MPSIAEVVQKKGETGVRFHEPSQQFIAEIGYHEVCEVLPDGTVRQKRVRTTHYLGGLRDRNGHIARYRSLKADWEGTVIELRKEYDAAQERRRRAGLPPLPRFKPVWPGRRVVRKARANSRHAAAELVIPPASPAAMPSVAAPAAPVRHPILDLTIREAYALHVEQQKRRVGLMAGKGINANTYEKHVQSLTLGLALNGTYTRPTRPIDLDKRVSDLTAADYEAFVQFWCDPTVVKSERTALNYTRAFRQMITRLDVPTPPKFNEIFTIKIMQPPKIVRYNPDLLRVFLQHKDERVRLLSLLCLNCGYYQVDIARLRFEHITDFEGNLKDIQRVFRERLNTAPEHRIRLPLVFDYRSYLLPLRTMPDLRLWPNTQSWGNEFRQFRWFLPVRLPEPLHPHLSKTLEALVISA